ncbi:hypothetical protein ACEN2J_08810 [Pseudorhodobacter sp. W20_MBD10_FR17]
MRFIFAFLTLSILAACGADGAPTAPGLHASGNVAVGVSTVN